MMPPLILIAAYVAGGAGFTGFEPVLVNDSALVSSRQNILILWLQIDLSIS